MLSFPQSAGTWIPKEIPFARTAEETAEDGEKGEQEGRRGGRGVCARLARANSAEREQGTGTVEEDGKGGDKKEERERERVFESPITRQNTDNSTVWSRTSADILSHEEALGKGDHVRRTRQKGFLPFRQPVCPGERARSRPTFLPIAKTIN